jgi:hypothetical protein
MVPTAPPPPVRRLLVVFALEEVRSLVDESVDLVRGLALEHLRAVLDLIIGDIREGIFGLVHEIVDIHGCSFAAPRMAHCGVYAGKHEGRLIRKEPAAYRGRYWDRTSDLFRVREARYRCANRPRTRISVPDAATAKVLARPLGLGYRRKMPTVSVGRATVSVDGEVRTVRAPIRTADGTANLWFRLPASTPQRLDNLGDITAGIATMIAMARAEDLAIEDDVSPELLENLEVVKDIFATWFPSALHRVDTHASGGSSEAPAPRAARGRSALCFSGGIDSTYSLVHSAPAPDLLVNALGFDLLVERRVIAAAAEARIRRAGATRGLPVCTVRTNARVLMRDNGVDWGPHGHGAALAALGHLLAETVETLIVPSTHSYATMQPWGSHPLSDPHHGSQRLRVVHHGATLNRAQKTAALAREPLLHTEVRVCLRTSSDENCGECGKCLRTMITLDLLGVLGDSQRFPQELDYAALDSFHVSQQQALQHLIDARALAAWRGVTGPTVTSLDGIIARSQRALVGS